MGKGIDTMNERTPDEKHISKDEKEIILYQERKKHFRHLDKLRWQVPGIVIFSSAAVAAFASQGKSEAPLPVVLMILGLFAFASFWFQVRLTGHLERLSKQFRASEKGGLFQLRQDDSTSPPPPFYKSAAFWFMLLNWVVGFTAFCAGVVLFCDAFVAWWYPTFPLVLSVGVSGIVLFSGRCEYNAKRKENLPAGRIRGKIVGWPWFIGAIILLIGVAVVVHRLGICEGESARKEVLATENSVDAYVGSGINEKINHKTAELEALLDERSKQDGILRDTLNKFKRTGVIDNGTDTEQ